MAFYSIHSFSHREVDFAVQLDDTTSTVCWGPRLEKSFRLPLQLSSCFPIRFPWFAFYDYGGDRVGVVSLSEGRVLWLETVKITAGGHIGVDEVTNEVAIQRNDQIFMHAAESGNLERKLLVPDRVQKICGPWIVATDASRTTIYGPGKSVILDQKAHHVEVFGEKLVGIDPRVALAVVDLSQGRIVRTLHPPEGSRFSAAHWSERDALTVGVSYFDHPRTTELWRFESIDQIQPSSVRVDCAGRYLLIGDGETAAFTAGPRYSVPTGKRIASS